MDFHSDHFTIAGTEYQGAVGGPAQGSEMGAAKDLALKAGFQNTPFCCNGNPLELVLLLSPSQS